MPCRDRYAWPVRIARFAAGGDPQYGVVELAEDGGRYPDTVSVLTGDPMTTNVCFGGPDLRTAYITISASGKLLSMEWPRPGAKLEYLNT